MTYFTVWDSENGNVFYDFKHKYVFAEMRPNGNLMIRYRLPAHLINLISRFYMGVE